MKNQNQKLPNYCLTILPSGAKKFGQIGYAVFNALGPTGQLMRVLEDCVFRGRKDIPANPVIVITPVVDGAIQIEAETDLKGNLT